jgi:hypothetical protein
MNLFLVFPVILQKFVRIFTAVAGRGVLQKYAPSVNLQTTHTKVYGKPTNPRTPSVQGRAAKA